MAQRYPREGGNVREASRKLKHSKVSKSGKGCPCFSKEELKAAKADWICEYNFKDDDTLALTSEERVEEEEGMPPPGQGFVVATPSDGWLPIICINFSERLPFPGDKYFTETVASITKEEETVCRNQIKKKCDSLGIEIKIVEL
jgi:hypothetical protein